MSFAQADLILRAFKSYECFYISTEDNSKFELIDGIAYKSEDAHSRPPEALKLQDGYILCERMRRL